MFSTNEQRIHAQDWTTALAAEHLQPLCCWHRANSRASRSWEKQALPYQQLETLRCLSQDLMEQVKKKKPSKDKDNMSHLCNEIHVTDRYSDVRPTIVQLMRPSTARNTFSKTDCILDHKGNHFQRMQ